MQIPASVLQQRALFCCVQVSLLTLKDSLEAQGASEVSIVQLKGSSRKLSTAYPCIDWNSIDSLLCIVIEGCRFDDGEPLKAYKGTLEACFCGICWSCLQHARESSASP